MKSALPIAVSLLACLHSAVAAGEPNETFAAATILSSDLLTVSDSLVAGVVSGSPDTLLGIRNGMGSIVQTDDDGSFFGNGAASGLQQVATNSGAIQFAVTGFGDDGFTGNHVQQGMYQVHVNVLNSGGAAVATFDELAAMTPGGVREFSYSNSAWIGGTYGVNINNQIPAGGDVDFFRFTGLTPGAMYTAATLDPASSGVDTILAWWGASGTLLDVDDDGGGGTLSRLAVAATAGGTATLAVSGFGDRQFQGTHTEAGTYQLRLTRSSGFAEADFDENGVVNAIDLMSWRAGFGMPTSATHLQGDANGDNDVDGADFLLWQRQVSIGTAMTIVPEPSTALLFPLVLAAIAVFARRMSPLSRT